MTGKPVETTGFRVYYRSLAKNSTGQFYCAFYGPGDLDGIARSTNGNWPICGGNATLHFMMQFPDCWDGKHLDSPNHKDHVAYGNGNACPTSHPVRIPAITFDIQYPRTASWAAGPATTTVTRSSGPGSSARSPHRPRSRTVRGRWYELR
ncbi:DUF1996 domain-containing protein [Micromonospora sp. DT201]|uniref:DUF1996 domain-containing protein n=1 Tax=Micromonospora sp. DT201 TaxID=3393442 RepID=UPI003CF782C4